MTSPAPIIPTHLNKGNRAFRYLSEQYELCVDRVIRYMVGPNLKLLWILALLTTPPFYFFDRLFDPTYDTLITRLIGSIPICIALYAIYTNQSERVIAQTSIFTATATMMWMFPAMVMLNAATTGDGQSLHYAWHCMYLISIFLYVQFVNNLVVAVCGWLLGLIVSLASILVVDEPNWSSVVANGLEPFSIFLTAIIFGNLLNRHTENVERDKTNSAKAIGGNIAHELRTPLMGIASRAGAVENLSPPPGV